MAFLLDTNICIHLRRANPRVQERFVTRSGEAIMSVVTYGELLYGIEKSTWPNALERLNIVLNLMRVEPLPLAAAEQYGRIRNELGKRGQLVGSNDLWIAAHALAGNYTLITDNEREFSRIDGLRCENWVRDAL
jgi:tRNA(fMet)-specific endonuclease VapC